MSLFQQAENYAKEYDVVLPAGWQRWKERIEKKMGLNVKLKPIQDKLKDTLE
jgi:hypothetical protein